MRFQQGQSYTFKNTESGQEIVCPFIIGNAKMLCFQPPVGPAITITKPPKGDDNISLNCQGSSYTLVKPAKGTKIGNGFSDAVNKEFANTIHDFVSLAKDLSTIAQEGDTSFHSDLGNGYIVRIRRVSERKVKASKPIGKKKRK